MEDVKIQPLVASSMHSCYCLGIESISANPSPVYVCSLLYGECWTDDYCASHIFNACKAECDMIVLQGLPQQLLRDLTNSISEARTPRPVPHQTPQIKPDAGLSC